MSREPLVDQEVVLEKGRFIYTRTDTRGSILSANALFLQISGHGPDEIIGSPHKLVRHPAMPRGLFYQLWQRLQAGQPFSGFVCNRTRDGRHYWLCSVVAPVEGGFLSVRTAPFGPQFEAAREAYSRMLVAEREGASPDQSIRLLSEILRDAGHATLDDFMAETLADHAREPARPDCQIRRICLLRDDLARLAETQAELLATMQKLYLIPTNMRILASRLEPSGGPVSAISDSYKRAASELMLRLHRYGAVPGTRHNVADRVEPGAGSNLMSKALFLTSAAAIVSRAAAQFANEAPVARVDRGAERAILSDLVREIDTLAQETTGAVTLDVTRIAKEAEHIKRLMAGLDQIRILGEVESGRIRNADGGLAAIMSQLTSFHGLIHSRLTAMSNAAARMHIEGA